MKLTVIALALCLASFAACPALAGKNKYQAPDESELVEHGSYRNSDGNEIHRPAHDKTNHIPTGATAVCRDGSFSFSQHRSGTCSRHGGVRAWL